MLISNIIWRELVINMPNTSASKITVIEHKFNYAVLAAWASGKIVTSYESDEYFQSFLDLSLTLKAKICLQEVRSGIVSL